MLPPRTARGDARIIFIAILLSETKEILFVWSYVMHFAFLENNRKQEKPAYIQLNPSLYPNNIFPTCIQDFVTKVYPTILPENWIEPTATVRPSNLKDITGRAKDAFERIMLISHDRILPLAYRPYIWANTIFIYIIELIIL